MEMKIDMQCIVTRECWRERETSKMEAGEGDYVK